MNAFSDREWFCVTYIIIVEKTLTTTTQLYMPICLAFLGTSITFYFYMNYCPSKILIKVIGDKNISKYRCWLYYIQHT